jgi:hypothetical protein
MSPECTTHGKADMIEARNDDLATCLRGMSYPATRTGMLEYATANGASDTVLGRLAEIPDREYGDLDDVGRQCQPDP